MKWEVIFPAQLMEMETGAPELGKAALDSGKFLQCTARAPYAYVCTLTGGQNTIGNGPVAIYHFKILGTAAAGTTTLRIQKAESTTADSKKWTLYDTEATVNIQR